MAGIAIWAAYVVPAVGLAILSSEPPHVTPLWSMLALGLGGVAVLAVRDRYPRAAFAGALALAVLSLAWGSGAEVVPAALAVFLVGVRYSASVAGICLGIALGFGALAALATTVRARVGPPVLGSVPPSLPRDPVLDWVNSAVIIAVVLVIAALLGTNMGHRRRHIAALVDRAERLARERDQQAETARVLERERIAREMHDVIAHSLAVMIAMSDGARVAAGDKPDEAREAMGRVAETGRATLGEVRRLLATVREEPVRDEPAPDEVASAGPGNAEPAGDDSPRTRPASGEPPSEQHARRPAQHSPQPGARQVPALVEEFVTAGLPVRLDVIGTPSTDPALGLTVYRIVQESLTNVLRHGREVTAVTVTVTWRAEGVEVEVRDDGTPAAGRSEDGRGILGMQERAALYRGVTEAGPHPAGGWCVIARLPSEVPRSERLRTERLRGEDR